MADPITATKRTDPISHIKWLDFTRRPDAETIAALKCAGWRWSGYRKQWYTNQRHPSIPENVTIEDDGECDYSAERSDRLAVRAQSHAAKSSAANARAEQISSFIPFGQPILVGHHSEKRHRRDLDRIHRATDTAIAEYKTAKRLNEASEASARFQARKQSVPAMYRRVERLRTDERIIRRGIENLGKDPNPASLSYYQRQLDELLPEIEKLEAAIAEAGGLLADRLKVHKGDLVRLDGSEVLITRVNAKTFSGVVASGGAKGWSMKWDRSRLQGIIRRADGSVPEPEAPSPEA